MCEQNYPNIKVPTYIFERSGDNFIWTLGKNPERIFNIVHEDDKFIIIINPRYFKYGHMLTATLSKKDNNWLMNNHDFDLRATDKKTRWSGVCQIAQ